jgi:hypothetical protein
MRRTPAEGGSGRMRQRWHPGMRTGAARFCLFLAKLMGQLIWGVRCLAGGHCGVAWNTVLLALLVGAATTPSSNMMG